MNELAIFNSEQFGELRTITIDGEVWFSAHDICKALEIGNPSQAVSKLRTSEKTSTLISNDSAATGKSTMLFVSEPGLYKLVFSSRKPEAERFQDWVMNDVIPSIRKTGGYIIGQEDSTISEDELIARALMVVQKRLEENNKRLKQIEQENHLLKERNEEIEPKANYYDIILSCANAIPIRIIAKDYGWSAQQMNGYLHSRGVQYKQGDTWLLYQKYADKGYTETKTTYHLNYFKQREADVYTCWTQKGREFIYNLLKEDEILPLIEREDNIGW